MSVASGDFFSNEITAEEEQRLIQDERAWQDAARNEGRAKSFKQAKYLYNGVLKVLRHRANGECRILDDCRAPEICKALAYLGRLRGFQQYEILEGLRTMAPYLSEQTRSAIVAEAAHIGPEGMSRIGPMIWLTEHEREMTEVIGMRTEVSPEERKEMRKAKDKVRKADRRLADGETPRKYSLAQLNPWETLKRGRSWWMKPGNLPDHLKAAIEALMRQAVDGVMNRADAKAAAQRLYADHLAAWTISSAMLVRKEEERKEEQETAADEIVSIVCAEACPYPPQEGQLSDGEARQLPHGCRPAGRGMGQRPMDAERERGGHIHTTEADSGGDAREGAAVGREGGKVGQKASDPAPMVEAARFLHQMLELIRPPHARRHGTRYVSAADFEPFEVPPDAPMEGAGRALSCADETP